jgi:hypothetical protein
MRVDVIPLVRGRTGRKTASHATSGMSWQLAAIMASGLVAGAGLAWLPHRRLLLFASLAAAAARALRPALPTLGAGWRRDLAPPESSPDKLGVSVNVRSTGVR